jgi:hypothetical protein
LYEASSTKLSAAEKRALTETKHRFLIRIRILMPSVICQPIAANHIEIHPSSVCEAGRDAFPSARIRQHGIAGRADRDDLVGLVRKRDARRREIAADGLFAICARVGYVPPPTGPWKILSEAEVVRALDDAAAIVKDGSHRARLENCTSAATFRIDVGGLLSAAT